MNGFARTTLTSDSAAEVAPKRALENSTSFPSQESSWLGAICSGLWMSVWMAEGLARLLLPRLISA